MGYVLCLIIGVVGGAIVTFLTMLPELDRLQQEGVQLRDRLDEALEAGKKAVTDLRSEPVRGDQIAEEQR